MPICGIVGEYGDVDELQGRRMLRRLAHRGPDDEGTVAIGRSWLGHRRLSIVDVAGGRQPLPNEDRTFYLVGNGEIYNNTNLRRSLSSHHFDTRSDNEAALHLVEERGPRALSELRGMYALLMAAADGRFLAARDPVGIKPLFWARRPGRVLFASELKAFDPDWLADVAEFPPGHYWSPEEGLVCFAPLPAPACPKAPDDADAASAAATAATWEKPLRETLTRAVRRRLMADVPVGVFLSGGLDSSLVASIAARMAAEHGERLHSFAVGTENSADLLAAREVASYLGTEHHERIYTPEEAAGLLHETIRSMELFDPATVRSALANVLVAELAAQSVKVVLTGEGSDELFAGYRYVRAIRGRAARHRELVHSVATLHHLNLQRCDRTTMRVGLEARVPFLDLDVIRLALAIPPELKLHPRLPDDPALDDDEAAGARQRSVEKWILRRAFRGYLPDSILWRTKVQFGDGSGAREALTGQPGVEEAPGLKAVPEWGKTADGLSLRTEEEGAYYRIFRRFYAGADVEHAVGRCESMV